MTDKNTEADHACMSGNTSLNFYLLKLLRDVAEPSIARNVASLLDRVLK